MFKVRLRSFTLAVLSFSLAILFNCSIRAQPLPAEQLNLEGFALLQTGAATEALVAWQEAEALYKEAGDAEAITGTQLNQVLALQALGLYPRACSSVAEAIALPRQICQPNQGNEPITFALSQIELTEVNLLGIRLLGESLTLLGNLPEAQAALELAQKSLLAESTGARQVALAMGNVHRLLSKEAIQLYERTSSRDAQLRRDTAAQISSEIVHAISQYQIAGGTKANLSLIDLFTDVHESLRALPPQSALALPDLQQLDMSAQSAHTSLNEDSFAQLSAIDAIYGRLNLAKNLIAIEGFGMASLGSIATTDIEPLVAMATAEARRIDDKRALSFAYGTSAELKALRNAPVAEIEANYVRALAIAQSIHASDAAYEWAYQLARLEETLGRIDASAQYYKSAISAITQVREDLVAVNTELRFDFREKIEPVYRDYISLLLTEGNEDLPQAVAIHDSLQLAQLENFLRCGRLLSSSKSSSDEVIIHIINLDDLVEVIVTNQNGTYGYSLPGEAVLQATRNLVLNIQSSSFLATPEAEFLPYSQFLYNQLLRPAVASDLILDADHLSFALDAPFRAIPMGLLHDGQQYLTATHTLSNSLQLQITDRQSTRDRALFAGISQQAPSFLETGLTPLPETAFEAESVKDFMRSKILLDSEFTVEAFDQVLSTSDYRIVHISTHGQFSSAPEKTYLAAWDSLIDIREMESLFRGAGSIDLLVLSACQTAAGDDRSTLGLSGMAVQASARSVIASLWLVDSTGSSVLMDRFYQAKSQGLDTGEALRQAQTELIESDAFHHPFYWAPFILVSG